MVDRISVLNKKVGKQNKHVSVAIQYNGPETNDMGVNTCEDPFLSLQMGTPLVASSYSETDDGVCKPKDDDAHFSLPEVCEKVEESSDSDNQVVARYVLNDDSKFIVFWLCLLPLLRVCSKCFCHAEIIAVITRGAMLMIKKVCSNYHDTVWYSNPRMGHMPLINLEMSAAVLYSGNTFTRIKEMMELCKVSFLGRTSYHDLQTRFLIPTVNNFFQKSRHKILSDIKWPIELAGDGRCDSLGNSAKYGTYTVMDIRSRNSLDVSVGHVGTVNNSYCMERQGLLNCLDSLESERLNITMLTTDGHSQIRSVMKNY